MSDMSSVIVPKSDQLNADDLIAGPISIRIADVKIRPGTEQPISVHYEGDGGKPYKPCKSMCRVMVTAWGADSSKYIGRSMTLYRDPAVKWGGMEVGGIRISHMSDIEGTFTLALTMTRANKKPFTVRPIVATEQKAAPPPSPVATGALPADGQAAGAAPSADEALLIKAREFAETGLESYRDWYLHRITKAQRDAIGAERHKQFKEIAEKVTA